MTPRPEPKPKPKPDPFLAKRQWPRDRKKGQPALGYLKKSHYVRISISFDPDTFAQINARVVRDVTSFSEQVRLLVELGLETLALEERKPHP